LFVCPVDGEEVWGRMSNATQSAEPLAVLASVVMPVERQAIAMRTEWIALVIISAFEARERILVTGVVTDLDRAQGVEGVVDKEQDLIKALSGIADHFRDVEMWKATAEVLEAGDGQEVVVTIGRGQGAGKGPEGEETVVDDVKGLVFVAKVMRAPPRWRSVG
jgi:hypothetical protein